MVKTRKKRTYPPSMTLSEKVFEEMAERRGLIAGQSLVSGEVTYIGSVKGGRGDGWDNINPDNKQSSPLYRD